MYPSFWTSGGTVIPPHVSPAAGTYFDGTAYSADGSAGAPFRQATLAPNGPTGAGAINDPNAVVTTGPAWYIASYRTKSYDLRWGTPDPAGPGYVNNYKSGSYTLDKSLTIFGGVAAKVGCTNVANVANCGPTIAAPNGDVLAAWSNGWTGKGSTILIYDNIGGFALDDNKQKIKNSDGNFALSAHPATVMTLAIRYAPGATALGLSYNNDSTTIVDSTFGYSISPSQSTAKIHVINASFGADLAGHIGRENLTSKPWTADELAEARTYFSGYQTTKVAYMKSSNFSGGYDLSDAVITKSAGNDHINYIDNPLNYYLLNDSATLARLVVVGALDGNGTPSARTAIASYSNTPGSDPLSQSRFLTASGGVAFQSNSIAYDGITQLGSNQGNVGTSYAAPRVAGYAAIVRQKFPNLTGVNTADILLATARYDTLKCYPNCDKAIYGQGEASLSRALAPVGYLR